jgi:hypothetical protein
VLVIDAIGKREVPVVAVAERQLEISHGRGGLPGPFRLPPIDGETAHTENARAMVVTIATGVGYSSRFSFEEALKNAITDAQRHLSSHIPDLLLKIEVISVGAEMGGFGGVHVLVVQVIASI